MSLYVSWLYTCLCKHYWFLFLLYLIDDYKGENALSGTAKLRNHNQRVERPVKTNQSELLWSNYVMFGMIDSRMYCTVLSPLTITICRLHVQCLFLIFPQTVRSNMSVLLSYKRNKCNSLICMTYLKQNNILLTFQRYSQSNWRC